MQTITVIEQRTSTSTIVRRLAAEKDLREGAAFMVPLVGAGGSGHASARFKAKNKWGYWFLVGDTLHSFKTLGNIYLL